MHAVHALVYVRSVVSQRSAHRMQPWSHAPVILGCGSVGGDPPPRRPWSLTCTVVVVHLTFLTLVLSVPGMHTCP